MMGYSARYHAASLAAVFLALAVGILVGVGFGSDIVSGTARNLEESLATDLDDARAQVDQLESRIEDEQRFGEAVYPVVVGERLRNRQIALIGLGGLSAETAAGIREAVESAGGEVAEIAVIGEPLDLAALAALLEGREARAVERGDVEALTALGVDAARLMLRGGPRFDALRGTLLSRYSGTPEGIDAVVVVREREVGFEVGETAAADALEEGVLAGMRSVGISAVAAELTSTEPSTIEYFDSRVLATVDSVDLLSGKLALVLALSAEAQGSFGVKESADSFLPELLERRGG